MNKKRKFIEWIKENYSEDEDFYQQLDEEVDLLLSQKKG